jgi:hypothetical protein
VSRRMGVDDRGGVLSCPLMDPRKGDPRDSLLMLSSLSGVVAVRDGDGCFQDADRGELDLFGKYSSLRIVSSDRDWEWWVCPDDWRSDARTCVNASIFSSLSSAGSGG